MAPKAKDGVSADAASFQFIFAVLMHNKSTIEPNWDDVAKECGISYGRNANTKFKDLIRKHGYRIDSGKVVSIDKSAPTLAATPEKATPANGKKAKTPANDKKWKITVEDGEGVDDQQNGVKVKMDSKLGRAGADRTNREDSADELA